MLENHSLSIAASLFLFAGIWWVVFEAIPNLIVEHTRGKLFDIRHRLFVAAAQDEIGFDHEGYISLRSQINAQIRFAHKSNLLHLVFLYKTFKNQRFFLDSVADDLHRLRESGTLQEAEMLERYEGEVGSAMRFRILWGEWYFLVPLLALAFILAPFTKISVGRREERIVKVAQAQAFAASEHEHMACA